jgi:UDP-N-acetyl-D-glucosamine dehydrogenase
VNGAMPEFVVERITDALNSAKKSINGSRIHVLGVAYKKDVGDVRESPALDILELLHRRGAQLSYSDPFVPSLETCGMTLKSQDPSQVTVDCGVICTNHSAFDYDAISNTFSLIVDTRNALKGRDSTAIFRL